MACCDDDLVELALNGELTKEEFVECRHEVVPNAVLDEKVDVFLVWKYFTNDAWLLVTDVLERKKSILFGSVRNVSITYIFTYLQAVFDVVSFKVCWADQESKM